MIETLILLTALAITIIVARRIDHIAVRIGEFITKTLR